MGKNKKYRNLLLLAGCIVIVLIFFLLMSFGNEKQENNKKVGFVLSGGAMEEGWNGMHYRGMKAACDEAEIDLLVAENVPEFSGQCEMAVRELEAAGCEMIILSSYGYSEEMYHIAEEYPDMVFYVNSSEYHAENMTSYFVRMYQARYLSGIIAGMMTENNQVGYVAAMSNNEVNRGISAFTLGVKRVNPEAEVVVTFTGAWDDESMEKEAAKELINSAGVDVITYHQNQSYVAEVADQAGIYSIGYHESNKEFSEKYLTTVKCDWSLIYKELVQAFLKGKANSTENFWIGMDTGAVGLGELSKSISEEVKKEIEKAKEEILSGKEIFSGEIYDMTGKLQCGEDELISDERLLEQFDWLVEGVRLYEK